MYQQMIRLPFGWLSRISVRSGAVVFCGPLALAIVFSASAQQPATAAAQTAAAAQNPIPNDAPAASVAAVAKPAPAQGNEITEAEVKQLLVGKQLFLLGGYLNDNLSFNEHGMLVGHSPAGSYTLNAIQIDRVRLTRHKVELEGARYALHFLGALPYEEIGKSVDQVKITPNKKSIRITIDPTV